jgi:transposase InsO family protein
MEKLERPPITDEELRQLVPE